MKPISLFLQYLMIVSISINSLVPVGYMPASQQQAGYNITICTGFGAKTIALNAEGQPVEQHPADRDSCPYALPIVAGVLPKAAETFVIALYQAEQQAVVQQRLAKQQGYIFPATRAPPVFS